MSAKASSILRAFSEIAHRVGPSVGGDAGTVLGYAALGAELVADIVDAGQNPYVAIPRLRSYLPDVNEARERIKDAIEDKFP